MGKLRTEADQTVSLYCQYIGLLISRILSKVVADCSIIEWNRIEILSWHKFSFDINLKVSWIILN